MSDDDESDDRDDIPWLRDMVEEELRELFSDDEMVVHAAVRRLVAEAPGEPWLEQQLIDLLDTSLSLHNDDTSASVWASLVLGEIRSRRGVEVLLRSLATDEDEELQDAAKVALLRVGAPAVQAIMDGLEGEDNPGLHVPGYAVLGSIGALEDAALRRTVLDFLGERLELERAHPAAERALDAVCLALAQLGDRERLERLRRMLAEDFGGRHAGLREASEMLEENPTGEPIVRNFAPWEERYGWLFEDARDRARVERPRGSPGQGGESDLEAELEEDAEDDDAKRRRDLDVLFWGLHAASLDHRRDDEEETGEDDEAGEDDEPPASGRLDDEGEDPEPEARPEPDDEDE